MLTEIFNPYYWQIGSFIFINIILSLGLYITLSTGQLSLGTAGFMSIGAYTSALLSLNCNLPVALSIIAGALTAGLFGALVGIPALRLKGVYLAIATLGFGEVIRAFTINTESLTSGSIGISSIPQIGRIITVKLAEFGIVFESELFDAPALSTFCSFIVLFILMAVLIFFFNRQNKSRVGRAYAAIKLDEVAAESIGINITYYKILAFFQSALIAGLGGALYAHTTGYISPSDFTYHRSIEILIFVIFGGQDYIFGSIFGVTVLSLIPEFLRFLKEYRYIFYGLIIMLMMAVRPAGIIDYHIINFISRKKKKNKG